jgi:muramoyltetrapeptide carboxypeptidase LdcA involved in peptidoglycan recycling
MTTRLDDLCLAINRDCDDRIDIIWSIIGGKNINNVTYYYE